MGDFVTLEKLILAATAALLLALLVVMLRALYRVGQRRGGGWWLVAALAGLALIAFPPLGWMPWMLVVLVDRESPRDRNEARRFIEFPGPDDPQFSADRQHALGIQPLITELRPQPEVAAASTHEGHARVGSDGHERLAA